MTIRPTTRPLDCAGALGVLALTAALSACQDVTFLEPSPPTDTASWGGDDTGGWGGDADWGSDDGDTGAGEAPPEEEDDFLALSPSQTDVYVFIANPTRGTVTRVNVYDLDVRTAEVGNTPTAVQVTPDYAYAAVFNAGDDSVSIVDADTLDVTTVDVRDNYNRMTMSGDGQWVALFHDEDVNDPFAPAPGGLQSFNEVSFVSIPDGTHYGMAVGYNPHDVTFSKDGTLAVVVTDETLALVDLTADELVPQLVPITDDFVDPPRAEEVLLTTGGDYAFVRQFGATDLVVVDLLTRDVARLPVGDNPTDLDLSPDGEQAVVVSRGSNELWVFDAADPFALPDVLQLPDSLVTGSLLFDPVGEQALLYTTATNQTMFATWDLDETITLRSLRKPIRGLSVTPDGGSVMILHDQSNGLGSTPETDPFHDAWALTLLDLQDFRQNPIKLPAEPIGWAQSPDGRRGYFIMDRELELVQVDYRTLLFDAIPLKSPPVYLGVLPRLPSQGAAPSPAWVSQDHPLGRLTFYHPGDDTLETLTGFELNSQIDEE